MTKFDQFERHECGWPINDGYCQYCDRQVSPPRLDTTATGTDLATYDPGADIKATQIRPKKLQHPTKETE